VVGGAHRACNISAIAISWSQPFTCRAGLP
jgi:hypothetical protein